MVQLKFYNKENQFLALVEAIRNYSEKEHHRVSEMNGLWNFQNLQIIDGYLDTFQQLDPESTSKAISVLNILLNVLDLYLVAIEDCPEAYTDNHETLLILTQNRLQHTIQRYCRVKIEAFCAPK